MKDVHVQHEDLGFPSIAQADTPWQDGEIHLTGFQKCVCTEMINFQASWVQPMGMNRTSKEVNPSTVDDHVAERNGYMDLYGIPWYTVCL